MNILAIYYSQTGQLRHIIETHFNHLSHVQVDYMPIKPKSDFPFPWKASQFFDAMPECVLQIAEPIEAMEFPKKEYDLIIFGHNPWFLSPNIPTTSFLNSEFAHILKNKPIITIIGARNMWLHAQEKVKAALIQHEAQLVGNIVLVDPRPNLISVLTIIRWTFKGIKEKSRFLPEAGVPEEVIQRCKTFGDTIVQAVQEGRLDQLQSKLVQQQAVQVQAGLVVLENRGITNFRKFAAKIISKGSRGSDARKPLVRLFQRLLIVGVFILSPISNFTAWISTLVNRKALNEKITYFQSIAYKKDMI